MESLFENTFIHAAIGMALVAPDGSWLDVNQSLCNLVGYNKNELLKLTFQDITHPEDLETDLSHVKEVLDGIIESYQMEKRYFHKNGNVIWVLLSVSLVTDNNNKPLYFISQIQDITQRKEMELKLQQTIKELEKALLEVKQLKAILSICSYCKKIRNEEKLWQEVSDYISENTNTQISHSICPPCYEKYIQPTLDEMRGNLESKS